MTLWRSPPTAWMLRAGVATGVEVVLNRNARGLRDGCDLGRRLERVAEQCDARVHTTRTEAALAAVAEDIASRDPRAVILAGGDGSCMMGLSALARAFGPRRLPAIAIAPAGTVGTIAKNLGLRGSRVAEDVIESVAKGSAHEVSWSTLGVREDTGKERLGFLFGAGLVARFFGIYDALPKKSLGHAAGIAARVFAGSFFGSPLSRQVLEPTRAALSVDGEPHPAKAWSLVVASSALRDAGLHFIVNYRAGEDPERFHVVASGLPPQALGPQMPRVLAGRPLLGEPRVDALARSIRIDFPDEPGAYVLDGDVFRSHAVTVETGPRIVLLVPASTMPAAAEPKRARPSEGP